MKQCSKCKSVKDNTDFGRRSKAEKYRLKSWCKVCERPRARAGTARYRSMHPERSVESSRLAQSKHYWKRPYSQLSEEEKVVVRVGLKQTRRKKIEKYRNFNKLSMRRYRKNHPEAAWRWIARFLLAGCSEYEREEFAKAYIAYRLTIQTLNQKTGAYGWYRKQHASVTSAPAIQTAVRPSGSDSNVIAELQEIELKSEAVSLKTSIDIPARSRGESLREDRKVSTQRKIVQRSILTFGIGMIERTPSHHYAE